MLQGKEELEKKLMKAKILSQKISSLDSPHTFISNAEMDKMVKEIKRNSEQIKESEKLHDQIRGLEQQVSISSTLYVQIFRTNVVFSSYVLALSKKFVQKICAFNVDEIDGRLEKSNFPVAFYQLRE